MQESLTGLSGYSSDTNQNRPDKNPRDYYFDNVKLLLIVLVVIGHIITPLTKSSHIVLTILLFIYSFHMPAFVLISGYFSKKYNTEKFKKHTWKILIIYLIFTVLYSIYNLLIKEDFGYNPIIIKPYWIMWYLLSLVIWRSLLPYVAKIKYNIIYLVIIAVIIGYINFDGYILSISRTLVYFPFFMAGYYLNKDIFYGLNSDRIKTLALLNFIGLFILLYISAYKFDYRWLLGSYTYYNLGVFHWYDGFYRLLIYALETLCLICFFALVSKAKTIFSKLGTKTLEIYLAHGFIVKAIFWFY
jgi:fucose 4-O-acetylase-like acetyltransferase